MFVNVTCVNVFCSNGQKSGFLSFQSSNAKFCIIGGMFLSSALNETASFSSSDEDSAATAV